MREGAALLFLLTAAASAAAPVELTGKHAFSSPLPLNLFQTLTVYFASSLAAASHPLPALRLPPAPLLVGEEGGSFCTCLRSHGCPSRLRGPSRFFHAFRVRANATCPSGLDLCFHRKRPVSGSAIVSPDLPVSTSVHTGYELRMSLTDILLMLFSYFP
uniref:Uncharacterized protein n=1 Tax=Oryza brachyantha TaxID=4533 RepID=J3NAQ6_ORYBR